MRGLRLNPVEQLVGLFIRHPRARFPESIGSAMHRAGYSEARLQLLPFLSQLDLDGLRLEADRELVRGLLPTVFAPQAQITSRYGQVFQCRRQREGIFQSREVGIVPTSSTGHSFVSIEPWTVLLPVIVLRLLHCFMFDVGSNGGLHLGIGTSLARFLTGACALYLRIRDFRW